MIDLDYGFPVTIDYQTASTLFDCIDPIANRDDATDAEREAAGLLHDSMTVARASMVTA